MFRDIEVAKSINMWGVATKKLSLLLPGSVPSARVPGRFRNIFGRFWDASRHASRTLPRDPSGTLPETLSEPLDEVSVFLRGPRPASVLRCGVLIENYALSLPGRFPDPSGTLPGYGTECQALSPHNEACGDQQQAI